MSQVKECWCSEGTRYSAPFIVLALPFESPISVHCYSTVYLDEYTNLHLLDGQAHTGIPCTECAVLHYTQHLHSSLLTQYSSMQSLASTYVVENKETKSCGLCVSCPFQHKPQCCIQDMGTRCTVCTFLPRCMSSRYATRSRSSESPARRDNE